MATAKTNKNPVALFAELLVLVGRLMILGFLLILFLGIAWAVIDGFIIR